MPGTTPNPIRPGRAVLRVASATATGLVLLGIVFVYLAVASVMPPPPGRPVGTPSALYGWWPLKLLGALLVANLVLATVLRVRPSWVNLGAWAAHGGVVLVAIGSVWYMAGAVSGFTVAARAPGGGEFAAMDTLFLNDTLAVYVGDAPAPASAVQTPVGGLLAAGGRTDGLAVAVPAALADVAVAVRAALPRAEMTHEFHDDGPAEVPAAAVIVADGPHTFRRVLCPAYPLNREFDLPPYVVRFAPAGTDAPPEWMLRRRSPAQDVVIVGATGRGRVGVLVLGGDGARTEKTADVGEKVTLTLGGREVALTVARLYRRAWRRWSAFAAEGSEHPGAVEIEIGVGEWRARQWVRVDGYVPAADADAAGVCRLPLPGGRAAFFRVAPESRPLSPPVRISHWELVTYPGSEKIRDYVCRLAPAGGGTGDAAVCRLNHPAAVGGRRFYQGSWRPSPRQPEAITLLVSSRPGLWLIWAGALLACLVGLPYAFYVKPILLRRRGGAAR